MDGLTRAVRVRRRGVCLGYTCQRRLTAPGQGSLARAAGWRAGRGNRPRHRVQAGRARTVCRAWLGGLPGHPEWGQDPPPWASYHQWPLAGPSAPPGLCWGLYPSGQGNRGARNRKSFCTRLLCPLRSFSHSACADHTLCSGLRARPWGAEKRAQPARHLEPVRVELHPPIQGGRASLGRGC